MGGERSGVVEQAAIFPEVAQARDEGQQGGEINNEPLDVGMASGVGFEDRFKEAAEGLVGGGHQHQVKHGDDLPEHFVFAQFLGGKHDVLTHGDLADAGDKELAREDQDGDPGGKGTFCDEHDEGGGDEDFVGQGVEEFTKVRDQIAGASDRAIEVIGDGGGGEDEDRQRKGVLDGQVKTNHKQNRQDETGEGEFIGEIHGGER